MSRKVRNFTEINQRKRGQMNVWSINILINREFIVVDVIVSLIGFNFPESTHLWFISSKEDVAKVYIITCPPSLDQNTDVLCER